MSQLAEVTTALSTLERLSEQKVLSFKMGAARARKKQEGFILRPQHEEVLAHIKDRGPVTRSEIVNGTSLTYNSLSRYLWDLVDQGYLLKNEQRKEFKRVVTYEVKS